MAQQQRRVAACMLLPVVRRNGRCVGALKGNHGRLNNGAEYLLAEAQRERAHKRRVEQYKGCQDLGLAQACTQHSAGEDTANATDGAVSAAEEARELLRDSRHRLLCQLVEQATNLTRGCTAHAVVCRHLNRAPRRLRAAAPAG